eukprot:NODE_270_length_12222_cov_0.321868.p4 type:complete len:142 gc:universal NODE_270_length_12222_cov_0.321868:10273-10698(+)
MSIQYLITRQIGLQFEESNRREIVDGKDSSFTMPLIQHCHILHTVWDHTTGNEAFSIAFLKDVHLNLMSGTNQKYKVIRAHVGAGNHQLMDPCVMLWNITHSIKRINSVSSLDQIMINLREYFLIHPFVNENGRIDRLVPD